jgi:hypothetical protein
MQYLLPFHCKHGCLVVPHWIGFLTIEDGTVRLSRNVGKEMVRNSLEKRSSRVVRAGILKSHISCLVLKRRSVFTARYELNV